MESALFFLALDNQTPSIQLLNPVRKVVFGGTEKKVIGGVKGVCIFSADITRYKRGGPEMVRDTR
jgi:hypothetical protein